MTISRVTKKWGHKREIRRCLRDFCCAKFHNLLQVHAVSFASAHRNSSEKRTQSHGPTYFSSTIGFAVTRIIACIQYWLVRLAFQETYQGTV